MSIEYLFGSGKDKLKKKEQYFTKSELTKKKYGLLMIWVNEYIERQIAQDINIVPAPIMDAASIQKLFFEP